MNKRYYNKFFKMWVNLDFLIFQCKFFSIHFDYGDTFELYYVSYNQKFAKIHRS